MTRSELKAIIKECLLEVLAEGLGNEQVLEAVSKRTISSQMPPKRTVSQTQSKKPVQSQQKSVPPVVSKKLNEIAGGNNVMQSLLADTLVNTVPVVINAERNGIIEGASVESQIAAAASDPSELFGDEEVSRWSSLAFGR